MDFLPGFIEFTSPQKQNNLILTYGWNSDVDFGLHDVFALQAWEGASVRPRVFLSVWLVKQKRSVSHKKLVLVQLGLTLPQVKGVSCFRVISQDDCGLTGRGEGPGEGEILQTLRGDAWDGQCVTLFLCYTLWKISYTQLFAFLCQKSSSLWKRYHYVSKTHLAFSERQSTPESCQPIWKSRSRYSWRDYPESSACSPQWTDPCGLWSWWLNFPEPPGQRGGPWPTSPVGRGRCCERSRWPSHQSSPWSLTGWELEEKQKRQQCASLTLIFSCALKRAGRHTGEAWFVHVVLSLTHSDLNPISICCKLQCADSLQQQPLAELLFQTNLLQMVLFCCSSVLLSTGCRFVRQIASMT